MKFYQRSGKRQGDSFSTLLFNVVVEVVASAMIQEKEMIGIKTEKALNCLYMQWHDHGCR